MNQKRPIFLTLLAFGFTFGANARIVRIQITRIESPTFEGAQFGSAGQYEKLVGRVSAVTSVARQLQQQRFLLEDDVQAYVKAAENSFVGK